MKVDERGFVAHDAEQLRGWLTSLRCAVALLYGTKSHVGAGAFGARADAATQHARSLTALVPGATLHALPSGHYLLEDEPIELRDVLAARLAQWTAAGLLDSTEPRRPETLGLRALPQYESIEAAQKALRGRTIPTMAAVRAALAEARADDEVPSDDDDDARRSSATALSKERADYFGFVG